ncbi:metal-dependent hydrolase [Dietzia sp. ANT_WB102]|uniref:metal-dependent hydrolase n=1 Tax=Dietzia sp. ANT_WB102 TaxID=2597345 RepID=UPI0021033BBA|nr:metal-dependent hydrolase [Dietzia sp. ANT_WB102]
MGPTHAMSGAAAGLAIGAFLPIGWGGAASATEVFVFAGVTAGAALLPDLDSPQSTLARSFGLVSKSVAHVTEKISKSIYRATMTRKDAPIRNGHRTATHTVWFALLAGAVTAALVTKFGKNSAIGVLFFMLGLAIRGLAPTWTKKQDWAYVTGLSLALAVAVWWALPASAGSAALGAAVTAGVLVHIFGDMITKRGVPLLGGVVSIGGKRWWNFRPPRPLRIRAGAGMDKVLALACTAVTLVLAYCVAAAPHLIGAPWAAVTVI